MGVLVVKVILSMKMKTYKEDQRLDLRTFLFLLCFIYFVHFIFAFTFKRVGYWG